MRAIGIIQAGVIQRRLAEQGAVAERTTESMLFGNATGQGTTEAGTAVTQGGIAEAVVSHNLTDYGDYYSFPLPVPGIEGQYSERRDESGVVHGIVQVQPPITMPDIPEEATLTEIQAALDRYEAERAENIEYVWDSMRPEQVNLHRGSTSVELSQLTLSQLMESARLLRRVAVTTALITNNHAMLAQLLPPEQDIRRPRAPRSVVRALEEQQGREAPTHQTDDQTGQ
jgi:hypothetical protein